MGDIALLRSLLSPADESNDNWMRLCTALDEMADDADFTSIIIPYILEHTAHWPIEACTAPEHWFTELDESHYSPKWRVVRNLRLQHVRWTVKQLRWLADQDTWENVQQLSLIGEPKLGGKKGWAALSSSSLMSQLKVVECKEFHLKPEHVESLVSASSFADWETLRLLRTRINDEKAGILADALDQSQLQELDLSANRLDQQGVAFIARAPGLQGLTHLRLGNQNVRQDVAVFNRIGTGGIEALAEATFVAELQHLDIAYNQLQDDAITTLAAGPFQSLQRLEGQSNYFTDKGLVELAKSSWFEQLTHLNINANKLGANGAKAWFNTAQMTHMQVLDCGRMSIGLAGAKALGTASEATQLQELNVRGNHLKIKGTHALFANEQLATLKTLDLSNNQLADDGFLALLQSTQLTALHTLRANRNALTSESLKALADATHFTALKHLSLNDNLLGEEGLTAFAASPHFSNLESIDLSRHYHFHQAWLERILYSPHFPLLRKIIWKGPTLYKDPEVEY